MSWHKCKRFLELDLYCPYHREGEEKDDRETDDDDLPLFLALAARRMSGKPGVQQWGRGARALEPGLAVRQAEEVVKGVPFPPPVGSGVAKPLGQESAVRVRVPVRSPWGSRVPGRVPGRVGVKLPGTVPMEVPIPYRPPSRDRGPILNAEPYRSPQWFGAEGEWRVARSIGRGELLVNDRNVRPELSKQHVGRRWRRGALAAGVAGATVAGGIWGMTRMRGGFGGLHFPSVINPARSPLRRP